MGIREILSSLSARRSDIDVIVTIIAAMTRGFVARAGGSDDTAHFVRAGRYRRHQSSITFSGDGDPLYSLDENNRDNFLCFPNGR